MLTRLLLALIAALGLSATTLAVQEEEHEEEAAHADADAAVDVDAAKPAAADAKPADDDEAEEEEEKSRMTSGTFSGLKWRGIGPAINSGRVGDFAMDPARPHEYFVAVSSGGVWHTKNNGTTFRPIFDSQASYSIGCLAMDPNNSSIIWVGSGENNSQRSVSFGDGVYVSRDGGGSWKNVGLKESEHIGMIAIDPRDSDTVFVAAQGPLWRSGGDRGLYKTTDGGETWECVLHISDDTGVNEVHMDPRNPDVMYASSYQRRRRVWTLINGGPESGIHKSTDGGATWVKMRGGLPGGDQGRIGLDISPANPDIVYAIIETASGGGVYRTTNCGSTWSKRSSYMTSSPQYYNELVCDPIDPDRVYALDTRLQRSDDGGATFNSVPGRRRHVDDHALWIDPGQTDHLIVGCDGGIYETWDAGNNWQYKPNLPVTQFYRVAVDNSEPFYFVYGGTQDNNTLGGPSRTISSEGIANEDWFVTVGGDGFEPAVDPEDPNTVYSQWQYGGLVRYDRRTRETVDIKPREHPGDDPYRWNWDSPLLISPHDSHRIYYGAQRLFQSDDRGDSWTAISGDLTRQLDRNTLEVMGRIQPPNAVAKHKSTSIYGNLVAVSESPLVEGLIFVGTDDGLIQITEDGGETWRKVDAFPDVPELSYVSCVTASRHDGDVVYATFDNHKSGDFKPYVLRSDDRGATWQSIASDLPERDIAYSLQEDHEVADLLFVGTEFGLYFTRDGGEKWIELGAGLPTIAVRDVEIQRRENDLVLATFGRGFYVLDDYSPLRTIDDEALDEDALIFPIKDALQYAPRGRGRGSQGATYFTTPNPAYGATFTYYLKESFPSLAAQRKKAEAEAKKEGETPPYPSTETLRDEAEARSPQVMLTVRDASGAVVQRLSASNSSGLHRTTWNLRRPGAGFVSGSGRDASSGSGPPVTPGRFTVTLERFEDNEFTPLAGPQTFDVVRLELAPIDEDAIEGAAAFHLDVQELQRVIAGAGRALSDARTRVGALRQAFFNTSDASPDLLVAADEIGERLKAINILMNGDSFKSGKMEPTDPSINGRMRTAQGSWRQSDPPTGTQREQYGYAKEAFEAVYADLRAIVEDDLPALEARFDEAGAPITPGRLPELPTRGGGQ